MRVRPLFYQKKKRKAGTAVLLIMLLVPILVFLARSISWLSSSTQFRALAYQNQIANTYLLEAGLAHAASLLEEDPEWSEGFQEEKLSHVGGTYSLSMQPQGHAYIPGNSVNNALGTEAVDGPRGPATVAPGTVELLITAKHGQVESQGQFTMAAQLDDLTPLALGSAGAISLNGQVNVTGISDSVTWTPVDSGIHSNKSGNSETAIEWAPNELGDQAHFSGKVSTTSRGDNAISFSGTDGIDYSASSFEDGGARVPIPSPDIVASVSANTSHGSPPLNNLGTTDLPNQDYYSRDSIDLQGDLILNLSLIHI